MELRTVNGRLRLDGAFKMVATGYLVGASVIFVPFFLLIFVILVVAGAFAPSGGAAASPGGPLAAFIPFLMFPFIIAMQSVMIGGLVVFGLWLYQMRRPIRVAPEDAEIGPSTSAADGG